MQQQGSSLLLSQPRSARKLHHQPCQMGARAVQLVPTAALDWISLVMTSAGTAKQTAAAVKWWRLLPQPSWLLLARRTPQPQNQISSRASLQTALSLQSRMEQPARVSLTPRRTEMGCWWREADSLATMRQKAFQKGSRQLAVTTAGTTQTSRPLALSQQHQRLLATAQLQPVICRSGRNRALRQWRHPAQQRTNLLGCQLRRGQPPQPQLHHSQLILRKLAHNSRMRAQTLGQLPITAHARPQPPEHQQRPNKRHKQKAERVASLGSLNPLAAAVQRIWSRPWWTCLKSCCWPGRAASRHDPLFTSKNLPYLAQCKGQPDDCLVSAET